MNSVSGAPKTKSKRKARLTAGRLSKEHASANTANESVTRKVVDYVMLDEDLPDTRIVDLVLLEEESQNNDATIKNLKETVTATREKEELYKNREKELEDKNAELRAALVDAESKLAMKESSQRNDQVFQKIQEELNASRLKLHALEKQSVEELSFVDLAGSERTKKSGSHGVQLKEAQSINKSLSALGDVVSALFSGNLHIPYRNHKLTMLMSDSVGGNAKTLMFVNISPAESNLEETNNSLMYASRVRAITNDPKKNVSSKEVLRLKKLLAYWKEKAGRKGDDEDLEEIQEERSITELYLLETQLVENHGCFDMQRDFIRKVK